MVKNLKRLFRPARLRMTNGFFPSPLKHPVFNPAAVAVFARADFSVQRG
jgi:hypothetical protein